MSLRPRTLPAGFIEPFLPTSTKRPPAGRKATLYIALAGVRDAIEMNDHMEHDDAALVFEHACTLGYEGIISKRKDSPYRSGRSPDWIKLKNPKAPAVKREAEEDWSHRGLHLAARRPPR
jgi:ATP-dependent DNA ligase